jgi:cardiolipin synthase
VQAIGEATTSVELCSPYLVPPPTLLFVLELAAARGVRVRITTNGPRTEAAILYHAQRWRYARMLAAGIEIHETVHEYEHGKVLVVDGKTVMVGSANMDLRSAHYNFELAAVVVDDPLLAAAVLATLDRRRLGFRRISKADLPLRPWQRVLDAACGLLSPIL